MSSCSAASRREAPPSTRAITRMRMSAEYAFGMVRPPDESMPPDSPTYRSLGTLRFYSARTCSSIFRRPIEWNCRRHLWHPDWLIHDPAGPSAEITTGAGLIAWAQRTYWSAVFAAFPQEPRYFVYGDRKKYSAYTNSFTAAIASLSFGETLNIGVTFEQYFRSAVAASVGPSVALGNPEDYIPPEGAFRLYAKDSDWKDRLDDLTKRASWILVEIGSSDALGWEFDHLRREGLQQKVFIITPPAREVVFAWWFIDFNRYVNGIGAVTWLQ